MHVIYGIIVWPGIEIASQHSHIANNNCSCHACIKLIIMHAYQLTLVLFNFPRGWSHADGQHI